MSRSSIGRTAALVAAVVGLALTAPGSAHAAGPTVIASGTTIGSATVLDVGVDGATRMVRAGSHLFLGTGDQIRVYSLAGHLVGTIAGQTGVSDLAVAADGTLYAALPNVSSVSVIDTTSLTETARISSLPCVGKLAVNSSVLFAADGCTRWQMTVEVIDRATRASSGPLTRTWYKQPLLAATDGRLVAVDDGLNPATTTSFEVSGTTVTEVASARTDLTDAVTLKPDGSRIAGPAMDNGYGIIELDPDTLQQVGFYTTGAYPNGAVYSADGGTLAASLNSSYTADLAVFSASTGATMTRRQALVPGQGAGSIVPGTITFDSAGTRVYGIAWNDYDPAPVARLAIISTSEPLPSVVKVKIGNRALGKSLPVSVTGRAGAKVALAVDSGGHKTSKTVTVTSSGVVSTTVKADYSGSVTATSPGDADYAAATATARFTAPSRTTLGLSGAYRTSKGVKYFHDYKDVLITTRIKPGGWHTVSLVSQLKTSGHWRTNQTLSLSLEDGVAYAHLLRGSKNTTFRVKVKFSGDQYLRASSSSYATFRIA